jgi:hypothetical protein
MSALVAAQLTVHLRLAGYRTSQVIRKRIEEISAGARQLAGFGRRPTAASSVDQHFKLTMVARHLTRMARMPGVMPQRALPWWGRCATPDRRPCAPPAKTDSMSPPFTSKLLLQTS